MFTFIATPSGSKRKSPKEFSYLKIAGCRTDKRVGLQEGGTNTVLIRLYRIKVNGYAYVSCSSFKPLVGAAWRGMHMSRRKVANAGTSRKKGAGRVAYRLPFIVPMMAHTVRKEGGGTPHEPPASHKSATRDDFTKKGNLAVGQIPFTYSNGAEGGTRTPTGFPTQPHGSQERKQGLLGIETRSDQTRNSIHINRLHVGPFPRWLGLPRFREHVVDPTRSLGFSHLNKLVMK